MKNRNIPKFMCLWQLPVHVSPTLIINYSVFCIHILYDSHYKQGIFPQTALPGDLCNSKELCFLWGTDWILAYYSDGLQFQRVNYASTHSFIPNISVLIFCIKPLTSLLVTHNYMIQNTLLKYIKQCQAWTVVQRTNKTSYLANHNIAQACTNPGARSPCCLTFSWQCLFWWVLYLCKLLCNIFKFVPCIWFHEVSGGFRTGK
jgi:hypothetical protein